MERFCPFVSRSWQWYGCRTMRQNQSLILTVLVGVVGCNTREFGSSVGRPASDPVERPGISPLVIGEIYVADAPSAQFVELVTRQTDETVDLTGYSLCGAASCITVAGELTSIGTYDIAELALNASFGELAVVDDTGEVAAYVAWGAEPTVFNSPWMARAVARGVTQAGSFAALPFPMPDGVAVVFDSDNCDAATCGCASPSRGNDDRELTLSLCPETRVSLELNELWTNGESSWVEIYNASLEAISLAGVRLCQLPSCIVFADQHLEADAYLVVHLGVEAPATPADNAVYFANARPLVLGGELVLLAPGGTDVSAEAEAFLSFVRFGSTTATLSRTAIVAGLWPDLLATARIPSFENEALSRSSVAENGADTWQPVAIEEGGNYVAGTPGSVNPDVSAASDEWYSCSFPRPWRVAPASELVMHTIQSSGIEIVNRSGDAIDLTDWVLEVDGVAIPLIENTLENLGTLSIEQTLTANHELSLLHAGVLRQFVLLGAPSTSTRLEEAVDAGVWPLDRCSLTFDHTLILRTGETGQSPADYR